MKSGGDGSGILMDELAIGRRPAETSHRLRMPNGVTIETRIDRAVPGGLPGASLKVRVSDALDTELVEEFTLNSRPLAGVGAHSLAPLPARRFLVAWADRDESDATPCIYARVYDLVGRSQSELIALASAPFPCAPALASLGDRGFLISWVAAHTLGGARIAAQRFDPAGIRVGPELAVNSKPVRDPAALMLTVLPSGGFVVSWREGDAPALRAGSMSTQMFDAAGGRVGEEFLCEFRASG